MDKAARHYYRAIIWFYASDCPEKALDELYQTLEYRPDHTGALALAGKIGSKKARSLPLAEDSEEETLQLLSFLEVQDRDRFFSALLSREEIGDFALSKIDWEEWEKIFANSPRHTDRIWYLMLRQNWKTSSSLCQQRSKENHGNVVAYFQMGYILFMTKDFKQAESFFLAMLPFGGIYRICAIRMLMRLVKHRFLSLSNIPTAFAKASVEELFSIAVILRNSWDEQAFSRVLRQLAKKICQGKDYLRLAYFYRDEDEQKQAMSCLYRAYKHTNDHGDLPLKTLQFAKTLGEKYRMHFFKWVSRQAKQSDVLWELADITRELAPKVALAIYRKLKKNSDPGKIELGRAIAFSHSNHFERANALFDKVAKDFPRLAMEALVWKARLLSRQEKYAQAVELLQKALDFSPQHPLALATLKKLGSRCPVCYARQESCPQCGYRALQTHRWEQGKLRWSGNKLFFPTALVLFTTDAQCYSNVQPVHLIVFSTCSQELQITFRSDEKVIREKRIGVTSGILVVREESFVAGLYEVTAKPEMGMANRHFFLVADTQAALRLSLQKPRWSSDDTLESSIFVQDILGLPLSGSIEIQSFSPFSSWHTSSDMECQKGIVHCAWHLAQCRDFIVIVATSKDGKRGCTIASPYNFLTEEELKDVVTQYQRASHRNLPLSLEKLTGEKASISFQQPYREVVIALQPISRGAIEIHRFQEIQKSQSITFPLKIPLGGFYLGTTRFFPGRHYQQTGLEMCGMFLGSLPKLSLSGKTKVAPGEQFTITITADKRVKGILLSCSQVDFYHPLSAYFLQKMADILSDATKESYAQAKFSTAFSIAPEQERSVDLQIFTACPSAKIVVTARADRGEQQIVCIASDGSFFTERDMKIEVFDPCWFEANFPTAIAMGDCIEKEICYYSEKNARLQVFSTVHGVLYDQVVQGEGELSVVINSPDTIAVSLAEIDKSYKIAPLEMAPVTVSTLHFLEVQDQWLQKKAQVYASGLELAEDITIALLADPHRDIETTAAKIYCVARLYQVCVKLNQSSSRWEGKLLELEESFCSQAKHFPDARWGYSQGFSPDKKITEEVLHHLSPFLEMPRFSGLHQLAKKTLAAALGWKISSNRLFFLSLMFQESKLKSVEAAAGALQYDLHSRKALKYLQRACKDRDNPHWQGRSLGGEEQSTALVCRAYREHKYPLKNVLAYFNNRLRNGVLATPPATVAFVDALLAMNHDSATIIAGNGTVSLAGKIEMESAFGVVQGEAWCREDIFTVDNLTKGFSNASLKITWEGPPELKPGNEFAFTIVTNVVKYPYLQLLIAPNAVVCQGAETFRGHMIWPCPAQKIRIVCKAACIGMADFHFLLQDRYDSERKLMKKYPLVVVR